MHRRGAAGARFVATTAAVVALSALLTGCADGGSGQASASSEYPPRGLNGDAAQCTEAVRIIDAELKALADAQAMQYAYENRLASTIYRLMEAAGSTTSSRVSGSAAAAPSSGALQRNIDSFRQSVGPDAGIEGLLRLRGDGAGDSVGMDDAQVSDAYTSSYAKWNALGVTASEMDTLLRQRDIAALDNALGRAQQAVIEMDERALRLLIDRKSQLDCADGS